MAVRLGLAMLALQASIGALNDIIDAGPDAGRKPGKPIPAGLVSVRAASIVVAIGAFGGILLAGPSGPIEVALAVAILAIGYAYDLRAKGTAWSWLPFAVGIPLLPVFAWLGATGHLPQAFTLLLPAAVAAGTALAIANARADQDRDAAAGVESVAIRLGAERAWVAHAVLFAVVAVVAVGSLVVRAVAPPGLATTTGAALLVAVGAAIGRADSPVRRERAWELEALGVAALAAAWLAAYGDLG